MDVSYNRVCRKTKKNYLWILISLCRDVILGIDTDTKTHCEVQRGIPERDFFETFWGTNTDQKRFPVWISVHNRLRI